MAIEHHDAEKHATYWFDDGSLTLRVQNHLFRVHRSLICRHSRVLLEAVAGAANAPDVVYILEGPAPDVVHEVASNKLKHPESNSDSVGGRIQTAEPILSKDFEELLRHLYHDELLNPSTPLNRVVSLLRISSSTHLDIPQIHELARAEFYRALPPDPLLLRPETHPFLYEGLTVATRFGFNEVKNAILYAIVTTHHFEEEEEQEKLTVHLCSNSATVVDAIPPQPNDTAPLGARQCPLESGPLDATTSEGAKLLSTDDLVLLRTLLSQLISHFTPILYTPSTSSSHMECTEAFADHWMPLVIQPSLDEESDYVGNQDGNEDKGNLSSNPNTSKTVPAIMSVYKPLETLETIKSIDWEAKGLCGKCVREKREEWTEEQKVVWENFGKWVEEASRR